MVKKTDIPYARHSRGKQAEVIAEKYLTQRGLRLLTKNFRCKLGEIDLILWDRGSLVFVEVRARANTHFAFPAETVDYHKQTKIIRTAEFFLLQYTQYAQHTCRFDVVGLDFSKAPVHIQWIKEAF